MKPSKIFAPVVFGALTLAGVTAHAGGTPAGSEIKNTATLGYAVNGVNQSTESDNTFKVDVKIDFTLELNDNEIRSTSLSQTDVVLASVLLSNNGNADGTFTIDVADLAVDETRTLFGNSLKDTFDLSSTNIAATKETSNSPTNDADAAVSAANNQITVTGLDADKSVSIQVTINKDQFAGVLNSSKLSIQEFDAKATHSLVDAALVAVVDSAGNANTDSVQFVFADGNNNVVGQVGDNSEKILQAIQLDLPYFPEPTDPNTPETEQGLFKSSRVIWDPINGALNTTQGSVVYPKAIPGAVVEYTITLRNFGSAAGQMTITDTVDSETELCQAVDNTPAKTGGTCIDVVHANKSDTVAEQTREQTSSDTTAPALNPATPVEAVITTSNGNISAVFATYPADQKAVIKYTVTIK